MEDVGESIGTDEVKENSLGKSDYAITSVLVRADTAISTDRTDGIDQVKTIIKVM